MLSDQEEFLLATLPQTEYGQALKRWLEEEIGLLEDKQEHGSKICNDPLIEDFRVQMGILIGFKRVLRKPQEIADKLQNRGD
jgi:hypothetical protein